MRLFLIGIATLTLASCNGAKDSANTAENVAAVEHPFNAAENAANAVDHVAAIENLTEREQQGVFFRAIRDADIPCRDVISVERVEPQGGVPTWRAQCEQGDAHLIIVKPDGSAQVMSRTR
jgi:hypothetical protein